MGLPVARLTDIAVGVCICHIHPIGQVGFIITASGSVRTNNLGNARITDIVLAACGHIGIIITGSSIAKVENLGQARVGDVTVGCFISSIVSGSPDTSCG